MRNYKIWLWLLLFGSLWGIGEVFAGGVLYKDSVPYASVWLTAWALFVLGVGRGVFNKPGSSTVIGAVATVFKLVNAAPFFCHLLGIFILGVAFDIASSLLMKQKRKIYTRSSFSGAAAAYGGYALFALVVTYIVRYKYWTVEGFSKVFHHIFVSGSFAALTAIFVVPLGYWIGINGVAMEKRHPRWTYAGALAALIALWILGRAAG